MAIEWHYISDYCALGVDWCYTSYDDRLVIAPKIYRWDEYRTDNYGGNFDEYLSPDPSGAGAWYDLDFGSGSGTRTLDTFASRTYDRTHSDQTISLTLSWENIGSYSGGFHSLGSGSHTWTLTCDKLASYAVKYNANGGSGAPSAQTKWYGENLTLSSDKPTRTGYTFQGWGTTSTDTTVDYAAGAKYTANKAITLYAIWKVVAPAAPKNLTVTRNSDNKATLSWENGANASITYEKIEIERKADGGSWSDVSSPSGAPTSYADTTTSADHYYQWRIRAVNSTGASTWVTCSTIVYNTPAAPAKVSAARSGENTVELTIANASNTANGVEVQRSSDMETILATLTVEGSPVTALADNPGGGTFYYRARNVRDGLVSAWSAWSDAVVTICAPAAPTLVSPASGSVVSKAQETIAFEHRHNPIDGSGQTAAQYRISTDDGATYAYYDIEGESEKLSLENTFDVNSTVTYGVRTKGAHTDYGPWSDNRVFYVYQEPSVAFTAPSDGFVIENTPVAIQLQYDDPSGTLAGATLSISDGSKTVYTRNMGTDTECDILKNEWLPENGVTYVLAVDVRSSSTLTATATREVTVSFVLPKPATLTIEPDPETGYVSLIAAVGESEPRSITWDGDTTGLDYLDMSGGDGTLLFYKVAEPIDAAAEDFYGKTITVIAFSYGAVDSFSETLTADSVMTDSGLVGFLMPQSGGGGEPYALLIPTDELASAMGAPSAGLYFRCIDSDYVRGYVSELTLPTVELAEPKSISVYRIYDGQSVLLGEDLPDGAGLVDMYAPLNEGYQYEVATFADSGAASRTRFDSRVTTDWAFMYFNGGLARCKWNPEWSHDMEPSAEYVHYMGDTYPTAHMDDFIDEVYPVTALVIGRDESKAFRKMMRAREPVVAKLWRGDVFWAVPKLSEKAQQGRAEWYEVSVNLNRVEGDAL